MRGAIEYPANANSHLQHCGTAVALEGFWSFLEMSKILSGKMTREALQRTMDVIKLQMTSRRARTRKTGR